MDIKEKLERHFNDYFEKQQEVDEAKTQQLDPLFTDKNEGKRAVEYFEKNVKSPFVKGNISTLGGRVAVFLKISLDKREDWKNGIFENSRYFTMEVEPDPTKNNLEQIQKDKELGKKFRKQKAKTLKEVVNKINKYIEGVK